MAKQVNFTENLKINGKDVFVEAGADARQFAKELGLAKNKTEELRSSVLHLNQIALSFQNLQNGLQSVTNVLNNLTEESSSFSSAMKAPNTMAGKDSAGFKELKGQVADLAKSIPMARDQLANGLYQVISNGVPEDNGSAILNPACSHQSSLKHQSSPVSAYTTGCFLLCHSLFCR